MTVGLTIEEAPELTKVPPQEPEYQYQLASDPRLPPVIPRVVEFPEHTGVIPVTAVAAEEAVFTVTMTLTHDVVLQVPSALTK